MTTGETPDSAQEPDSAPQEAVLDGPAAENEEMRLGTADLQSSEEKSAAATEIVNKLKGDTQPESNG